MRWYKNWKTVFSPCSSSPGISINHREPDCLLVYCSSAAPLRARHQCRRRCPCMLLRREKRSCPRIPAAGLNKNSYIIVTWKDNLWIENRWQI
jgi:hypothetical protein